jgi:hypothetical protein
VLRWGRTSALAAVVGATVAVGAVASAAGEATTADPKQSLACVAPLDAPGLDAVLARAASPLAGEGAVFVRESAAWGLDPRALVAIATHETILATYGPSQPIRNPFGIGPGRSFPTYADAISFAAELLSRHYVGEGRRTLADISGQWAPIGAANDPQNLNANWTTGVGISYSRLGGDPDAPITLDRQGGTDCAAAVAPPSPVGAPGQPATGVVAWTGAPPRVDGPLMELGADPATGAPATIDGFVFPMVPGGSPIAYRDGFTDPVGAGGGCFGRPMRCAIEIQADPGTVVVSAAAGVLSAATPQEFTSGIAFWLTTPSGDRVGYGGLASYAPGIADRVPVAAGQALGATTGATALAWERDGVRVNPFPLLAATLPPAA